MKYILMKKPQILIQKIFPTLSTQSTQSPQNPVHVVCLSGSLISDPITIREKTGPIQIELLNSASKNRVRLQTGPICPMSKILLG